MIAALHAADEVGVAFPRIFVDADVVLRPTTVSDLVRALCEQGKLSVAPPCNLEFRGDRTWVVRAYSEGRPYVMQRGVGSV